MSLQVISYGGGVQSTALVVLSAQEKLPFRTALFANVGDDSEHPATIRYVRDVMIPWAQARGVTIHELRRMTKGQNHETLFENLNRRTSPSIPVRAENGAPGKRSCTTDYKIKVIGRWLRTHGATKEIPAVVAIGFSLDEIHRLGGNRQSDIEQPVYPLLDLRLDREACKRLIEAAGLPVPPKSACYFCPFHRPSMWARMRRDEPDLFEKAADLEDTLNQRRDMLGKDHVYLTRFAKPLREAIAERPPDLPFDDLGSEGCDEGYCWT